ncbi:MAG TPA: hypothetical protein VGV59_13195 [Pyrinomonadaceae bacterium]|nr:hypothetical protein [Pyrinomonadaceae bacterium]
MSKPLEETGELRGLEEIVVVANPGSTLGEAIGDLIEDEVNRILRPIAEENGCVYVSAGLANPKTGRPTKLLLKDAAGNEYNIDAVIANQRMQPLVLIESKYIRYKKHNRDKGSWICTAHYSLRRTFPSVRKSIAILAGSWSGSSKAMMESFDVSLFEVGFRDIVDALAQYGIDFAWEEKERDKAMAAWERWQELDKDDYNEIARMLLAEIEPRLRESLAVTLNTETPRELRAVEITIETNLGESRRYTFESINEAVKFLGEFDEDEILNAEDDPAIREIKKTADAPQSEE